MKRSLATGPSDGDSESSDHVDDVVGAVQSKKDKFSVQWMFFQDDDETAKEYAVSIVEHPDVESWYVGACKDPYDRFFEEPSPHCVRFHCLYPVWLGKKAGGIEIDILRHCRWARTDISKCANAPASRGGEGISPLSIRFVYVCVEWTRASVQVL